MLSVLIRTKNEADNIARAINSVKDIADEVIVVDSGSTDGTQEIASSLGAKVYYKEWEGYAKQINYGLSLCQGDWVLVLDADEELSRDLGESIKEEMKNPKHVGYKVCRRTYYAGAFLKHTWYPEWRLRLFRKDRIKIEARGPHENYTLLGSAGYLKGDLYHYSYRSLLDQYQKTLRYAHLMAQQMHKDGRRFRLYNLLLNPLWAFFKVYFLKFGFLDGMRGFSVAMSSFIYRFLKYLFLWELEQKEKYGDKLWRP